jgi:hypothetical protein
MYAHESSVREDMFSIYYTYVNHGRAITLTVLRVEAEYIACDITEHSPDLGSDQVCGTLRLPGVCIVTSLALSRKFYHALQPDGDRTHRVDDEVVFNALESRWAEAFGGVA